jgi:MoaA/NifB/PqqE/SkfB family radical SAM enzyme
MERAATDPLLDIGNHVLANGGSLRSPLLVSIELTDRCNQRCPFCIQSARRGMRGHDLSFAALDRLCRRLKETGVASVSLTGGEPTCHPRFADAVEGVKRRDLALAIETNGVDLTEARVRHLAAVLEPERDVIVLALDAASPDTYLELRGSPCFEALKATLDSFGRHRIPFVAHTLLLRGNLGEIGDIRRLALGAGAMHHRVGLPCRKGPAPRDLFLSPDEERAACERLRRSGIRVPSAGTAAPPCAAGRVSCAVDARGRVGMCLFGLDAGLSAGNIRREDFPELWMKVSRMGRGARSPCPLPAGAP